MKKWLSWLALKTTDVVGSAYSFLLALMIVLVWLALGPAMNYSERWMIAFNTGICVVTFLMVFLIQNAQNRNAKALHLKINELIRGVEGPRTHLVDVEQRSDEELKKLNHEFAKVAQQARSEVDQAASQAARDIVDATQESATRLSPATEPADPASAPRENRRH